MTIQEITPLSLGDDFINGTDIEIHGGTSVSVFGTTKMGKTTLVASCARINGKLSPVIVIDTENNFGLAVKLLPKEEQELFQVVEVMVPLKRGVDTTDKKTPKRGKAPVEGEKLESPIDIPASLIKLNKALKNIADAIAAEPPYGGTGAAGTIAFDSASDFYDWRNRYFEMPGNHRVDGKGNILRFDWKTVTEQYIDAIQTMLLSNWNVLLTFKSKPIFVEASETELQKPHWHKQTGFYVRMEIEMSHDGQDFIAEMVQDRYGNIGSTLKNPTFDDILSEIEDKTGLNIR